MQQIRFQQNWNNKLNARILSTIRETKHDGFFRVGCEYALFFKQETEPFKIVRMIDGISIKDMSKCPSHLLYLETGYERTEALKIFTSLNHNKPLEGKEMVAVFLETIHTYRMIEETKITHEAYLKTSQNKAA